MHVKLESKPTLRTFASVDMAVGKVEKFLNNLTKEHEHHLHWVIVPVPVAPESTECRFAPVFFCVAPEARWLMVHIARHGWPIYA
jgi:hypothetical protein